MEIYIEKAFLDSFWQAYVSKQDTEIHDQVRRFFRKANFGRVILDIPLPASAKELIELSEANPLLEDILNSKSFEATPVFMQNAMKADFYIEGIEAKYFFLGNDADATQIEARFGCVAVTNTALHKMGFLFQTYVIPVSQQIKNLTDWSFIQDYRHPCNALILSDNYLLADHSGRQDENLLRILKNILPRSLDVADSILKCNSLAFR